MLEDLDSRESVANEDMRDAQAALHGLKKESQSAIWITIILAVGAYWFLRDELSTSSMLFAGIALGAFCQFYRVLLENRCEILRAEMRQLHRESIP
jgi:hypothetical protein